MCKEIKKAGSFDPASGLCENLPQFFHQGQLFYGLSDPYDMSFSSLHVSTSAGLFGIGTHVGPLSN